MMEKEKVRSLEKMPSQNKLAYGKILTLMVRADLPISQLKVAELYRLLANIRVASGTRTEILNFLMEPNQEVEQLCEELLEEVNQQEKNILRFSLIKDLMIIMGADYIRMSQEKELLKMVEEILEITEEQKEFLKEEYQHDQTFHEDSKKKNLSKEIFNETIAKATALGIPLSVVYFSGLLRGFGPIGTLLGLEKIGGKKYTKRYSSAVGLGVMIMGAFSAYHLVKWGLGLNRDHELELENLIQERMNTIHQRAIKYLERDIDLWEQETQTQLLRKTHALLKNTKPRII